MVPSLVIFVINVIGPDRRVGPFFASSWLAPTNVCVCLTGHIAGHGKIGEKGPEFYVEACIRYPFYERTPRAVRALL